MLFSTTMTLIIVPLIMATKETEDIHRIVETTLAKSEALPVMPAEESTVPTWQ